MLTSIRTGELCSRAVALASKVALYTACASPPSTLMLGMPYDGPLPAMPSPATKTPISSGMQHRERAPFPVICSINSVPACCTLQQAQVSQLPLC